MDLGAARLPEPAERAARRDRAPARDHDPVGSLKAGLPRRPSPLSRLAGATRHAVPRPTRI
ncbi:hypothetical protein BGLA2_520034 [Burkholderia gladioli]|nr:hypothetical protein BGLA2_520034 [Burkholderia gladioli]